MLASVLIIGVSAALFVYWFRYTCLLILSTKTAKNYAQDVATANQLTFIDMRNRLSGEFAQSDSPNRLLEQVYASLDRDYRVVNYLLQHAANHEAVTEPLDHWLLRFDYHLMQAWYRVARLFSASLARQALLEMTSIVNHLANSMGHRIAVSVRA